jgi:hypothetical protein
MSLINDAIKRASQTEKNRSGNPPSAPPMQLARESRGSGFPIGIVLCVIVLLGAAGWLGFRYFAPRHVDPVAPVHPAPTSVAAKPAPIIEPAPIPAAVPIAAIAPTPAATTNSPPTPIASAPSPSFPPLKLQGIFFSHTNPKVIINGQTYGENAMIAQVRVAKIYPDKVTLEWQGQAKDLRLVNQ